MANGTTSIGIDLGTTNTLVSVFEKGKIKCLKFGNSEMLQSVIYIDEESDEITVGQKAKNKGMSNPKNVIKSSKTYMGDFNKKWKIGKYELSPTDVATEILKAVKENVQKKLKLEEDEIIEAVITVPETFNSNQKDETKKAGERAGLKIKRILTEPVAAAIAYGRELENKEKIFVVDLGGGTFDVTLLEADSKEEKYTTLVTDGDRKLGGDNFEEAILIKLIEYAKEDIGVDLTSLENSGLPKNDYYALVSKLQIEAENIKIGLSDEERYEVRLVNFCYYSGNDYNFELNITRDQFNQWCQSIYEKIEVIIKRALNSKGINLKEVDRVILAGGSSYIPKIAEIVRNIFNKPPCSDLDLSTLVVKGACIIANGKSGITKSGKEVIISDILSHSLGIAVQLGNRETLSIILERGEKYPCSKKSLYTTSYDDQKAVNIRVYEGETIEKVEENDFYGSFTLEGIEKAKKGIPQIEVTFQFDESGILTVTAEDLKTNAVKKVVMKKGERISEANQNPMDIALLFDTSGSMSSDMGVAKKACESLITDLIDLNNHRLGLIEFNSYARVKTALTQNRDELINSVKTLSTTGSTNMHDAVKLSVDMLKNSKQEKIAILVTDGGPDSAPSVLIEARRANLENIKIITIGIGNHVDSTFLKSISSTNKKGEREYYYASDINKLRDAFETVMNSITKM